MAKLADSRVITEDELDSITLETTIEEILGIFYVLLAMLMTTCINFISCLCI